MKTQYNPHSTKAAHHSRVFKLGMLGLKHDYQNRALVSLVCTRHQEETRNGRKVWVTHPSQDLQTWGKSFRPENVYAINRDEAMREDVAKYHPGASFVPGDAVECMAALAGRGVWGFYYLDLMCTFGTVESEHAESMSEFFRCAPKHTVIVVNCMFYASRRKPGEVSDVPRMKQRQVIRSFRQRFADNLGSWEFVGSDFYQSASRVRTPMMSVIFRRK